MVIVGPTPWEYPVHLGIAYIFFSGYVWRTAFLTAYLPGAVGVILSGFIFSYFIQAEILASRDTLQGLAFFLVLLTAGFEISITDLKPYVLIYTVLPSTLELLSIAAYAVYFMEYTLVEGLVLGNTLFCIGDGLVIPRMLEFIRAFPGHPMPPFVFMAAPLEGTYALTLFGVLGGFAAPAEHPDDQVATTIAANILRILTTLALGTLIGWLVGLFIATRATWTFSGKALFNGQPVESYLMVLAVALAGFGLAEGYHEKVMVPMGFSPGSLFQPELLVIVIGAVFAHFAGHDEVHKMEPIIAGVWVFGQLILFSMLGSKTDTSVFTYLPRVLPLMFVGICSRFIGVCLSFLITLRLRPCACDVCLKANWESLVPDAVFCFLSTLPRATIQGAIGPGPMLQQFFSRNKNGKQVDIFIANAARLYIVCMGVLGSVLLDLWGPRMLEAAAKRSQRCPVEQQREQELAEEVTMCNATSHAAWSRRRRSMSNMHVAHSHRFPRIDKQASPKLQALADEYNVDVVDLINALNSRAVRRSRCATAETAMTDESSFQLGSWRRQGTPAIDELPESECEKPRFARRRRSSFAIFEERPMVRERIDELNDDDVHDIEDDSSLEDTSDDEVDACSPVGMGDYGV